MVQDPNTSIAFSSTAQRSQSLQRIALAALQRDKNDRSSAAEIYGMLEEVAEYMSFCVDEISDLLQLGQRNQCIII